MRCRHSLTEQRPNPPRKMKRVHKIILILCAVLLLGVGGVCTLYFRHHQPVSDGRTREERQRIAEALFAMLHSSLTNEVEIKADNPLVPEVIRALHPFDIEVMGRDAVIMCPGKPAEYHLASRSQDPKTWILYVAGPGYFGHQETMRIKKE
jgi:hypothetical protein